jgi:mannose-1-phosphate guanylyltransferase
MGFLRLAARRARKLSSPANVIVSAQEGDRRTWEGPFWFTRATNRFISELGTPTSLSTAAAMLSIATRDPSCPIAVLPSDFWVARESVLTEAIEKAFGQLQTMPESVATLGMIDSYPHPGGEEDYLVVGPRHGQKGAAIQAQINRPERRLAKQLISEVERKFSAFAYRQIPRLAMHSVRLSPPTFPARAFAVQGSGWCSRQFSGI